MNWIPRGGGGFLRSDTTFHSFDTLEDKTMRQTIILTLRTEKRIDEAFFEGII